MWSCSEEALARPGGKDKRSLKCLKSAFTMYCNMHPQQCQAQIVAHRRAGKNSYADFTIGA